MATDLKTLLKRAVELAMPDLRAYYRVLRKARVVATYPSEDGRYWADVQPLRNDESVDENEPMIPRVEIPVLWGGPDRGVVCPPAVGTLCDLEYYDGDPNHPRISNFRWAGNGAPACEVGALIIQHSDGTYIKIDAHKNLIEVTPANRVSTIGGNKTETIGGVWTIKAPLIIQEGNVQASGPNGTIGSVTCQAHTAQQGSYTLTGPIKCTSLEVTGDATIAGNCHAGSRSGGEI
jgi:hypothetical protein